MVQSAHSDFTSPLVVFDFDHTLTDRETLSRFLLTRLPIWRVLRGLITLPLVVGAFWLKWGPREGSKRAALYSFLRGLEEQTFQSLATSYSKELPQCLRPEMKRRLENILRSSQEVWLVSGSLTAYLSPLAESLGISVVLACDMAVGKAGKLTGRLRGDNCWGPEKLRRLRLMEPSAHRPLVMYGDSKGDRELLQAAWEGHFFKRSKIF